MKVVLIGVGCVMCGVALWFFVFSQKTPEPSTMESLPQTDSGTTQTLPHTKSVPAGHRMFTSEPFLFSLMFAERVTSEEFAEKGDARTFVFTDPETNYSFQIYVTPYAKEVIDTERFMRDQPSGIKEGEQQTMIDGVPAVVFGGRNAVMGDTREVWFIHKGFLYEVTTYRELDAWLSEIMATWSFIE